MIKTNYLKSIRKQLGLKQYDVTNGQITRNSISHIENQKISLTEKTIKLIQDTINSHLIKEDHFIRLDYDDLFCEDRFKNKLLAEELYMELELLNNIDNANLEILVNELNILMAKWNFPVIKMKFNDLMGNHYYERFDYNTSQYYYNQAVSSAYRIGSLNDISRTVLKLMRADIMTNSTSNSLELAKQLISRKSEFELDTYLALLFNAALIFEKNSDYNNALTNLREIENYSDEMDSEKLLDILLLKAICYESLGDYEEALKVYQDLLSSPLTLDDYGKKANINCSTLALFIKQNNKQDIISTIKHVDNSLSSIDCNNLYLPGVYLELGYGHQYLKEYNVAQDYFNKSINCAIKINEYYDLAEALASYLKVSEILQSPISHTTTLLILQLLSSKKLDSNDNTIFYYISYLEKNTAYEELRFFIDNIMKIRKENI